MKGVVLIAAGHFLYGRLAYNLAVSIKAKDPSLPICLFYNGNALDHLTEVQRSVFDQLEKVEGGWRKVRFSIPEITPFDQTLFLDVDMVWLKDNPISVFDILDQTDFSTVNEGFYDLETKQDYTSKYGWGCDLSDLITSYRLKKGKLWKIRGEFMVFRKSKKVVSLFEKAGQFCSAPKINTRLFAGGTPTEWAFDVALNKIGMDCHLANWQPAYWPAMNGNLVPQLHILNKQYFALSAGGGRVSDNQRQAYDLAMDAACYKLGIKHLFKLRSKNQFLTERKNF